ncbi:MAG: hydroxymethylglutaryl-CoA reductase, degradative [Bradymonadales bacterium]|nr:hydroxymethylglutaryl-CoA reductase, degradative [Bradymonadales bacterium]
METSRLSGFYRLSIAERQERLASRLSRPVEELRHTFSQGGLSLEAADALVENVVGLYGLPFALATNFLVNGGEVLVPMVVEEPSVVAAASNAARMARDGGGFRMEALSSLMVCQVQIFVDDLDQAMQRIRDRQEEILAMAAAADPVLVSVGGGPREIVLRPFHDELRGERFLVVHLVIDVGDAMGANTVNTMGETIAPRLAELTGGRVGLRILTNLADRRLVRGEVSMPPSSLSTGGFDGAQVAEGIVRASRFAELDPYRAATHNKGVMNGIDAVVIACGNDWRAVEAGVHAYAARSGVYRPVCTWRRDKEGMLIGRFEAPLAVGTVGGAMRVHELARLALSVIGAQHAGDLAMVAAAAGMANNLAALRALASEGIQEGHMRLHRRSEQTAT